VACSNLRAVTVTIGILSNKSGCGYTVIDHASMAVTEERLEIPASIKGRGEQLDWLLAEAIRMLERASPDRIWIQKGGAGQFSASSERHEVEGILQVAAFRARVSYRMETTEGARAKLGVPKGAGAYKTLLKRPDIAARSNDSKRQQYAYALAAL
jgi:hypothetical protein